MKTDSSKTQTAMDGRDNEDALSMTLRAAADAERKAAFGAMTTATQTTQRAVCTNCGQWQDGGDCFNECVARGFAIVTARTITYYAVAIHPVTRKIAQLLVTRSASGNTQTWTGVEYATQRAANADLIALNCGGKASR